MTDTTTKKRFALGRVFITPGAKSSFDETQESPLDFIYRHVQGDWGDISPEDAKENEFSVQKGFRIMSSYKLNNGVRIWIITEADRSYTTILLPSEY